MSLKSDHIIDKLEKQIQVLRDAILILPWVQGSAENGNLDWCFWCKAYRIDWHKDNCQRKIALLASE